MKFTRLDNRTLERLAEFLLYSNQRYGEDCIFSAGAEFENEKVFIVIIDCYLGLGHDPNQFTLAVITENEIFRAVTEESGDLFEVVFIENKYGDIIQPTEYQLKFYKYIEQSGKILNPFNFILSEYFEDEENKRHEKEMRLKYGIK